jgi:hypothetical protein
MLGQLLITAVTGKVGSMAEVEFQEQYGHAGRHVVSDLSTTRISS